MLWAWHLTLGSLAGQGCARQQSGQERGEHSRGKTERRGKDVDAVPGSCSRAGNRERRKRECLAEKRLQWRERGTSLQAPPARARAGPHRTAPRGVWHRKLSSEDAPRASVCRTRPSGRNLGLKLSWEDAPKAPVCRSRPCGRNCGIFGSVSRLAAGGGAPWWRRGSSALVPLPCPALPRTAPTLLWTKELQAGESVRDLHWCVLNNFCHDIDCSQHAQVLFCN